MKILVAVDSVEFNKAIADFVLKHQWQPGSIFRIIHVIEPEYFGADISLLPFLDSVSANDRREGESLTADLKGRIFAEELNLELTTDVLEGHPCDRIVDTAREWKADLIIVGSHGRKGLSRFTLGSVSSAVVALAPCSVLVVRLPDVAEKVTVKRAEMTASK